MVLTVQEMFGRADCELCGERFRSINEEIGEFWDEEKQDSVIAHASCGLERGMEIA